MAVQIKLLEHIQKSLKAILSELSLIHVALKDSSDTVPIISNLCEQLQCCQKYDHHQSPLSQYDDLQPRLSYKINMAIERNMRGLHQTVKVLEDASSKITSRHHNLFEFYLQVDNLSITDLSRGSALYPSPAVMMEWISDLERRASFILSEKRHLLDTCNLTSDECVTKLTKRWGNDHGLKKRISEIKAFSSYFLEEKLA